MLLFAILSSHLSVNKIRGVSPINAGEYRRAVNFRKNTFRCFDKSKIINLSLLNDGYCDCPDGSDEPGTNACGVGEFYCKNIGSLPKLIPKWLVGDGVCDCCDGSDELNNTHSKCEDVCGAIRVRSIEFRKNLTNLTIEGSKIRAKYTDRARVELSIRRKQLQYVDALKTKLGKGSDLIEKIYWKIRDKSDASDFMIQLNETILQMGLDFSEEEKSEKMIRKGSRKIKTEKPLFGRFNLRNRATLKFNVENCLVYLPDFSFLFEKIKNGLTILETFYSEFTQQKLPKKNQLIS